MTDLSPEVGKKISSFSSFVNLSISQILEISEVLNSRSPFIFKYSDCRESSICSAIAVIGIRLSDIRSFKYCRFNFHHLRF